MKRILALMFVILLTFSMISCDSKTDKTINDTVENESNEAIEDVNDETKENTSKESADEVESDTAVEPTDETEESSSQPEYEFTAIDVTQLDDTNRPVVTITFEDGQKIVLKLVPEVAPNTVNSFVTSINDGFYDGLTFHRIIKGFMIQGGDSAGTGMGSSGFTIDDEFYVIDELNVTYLSHTIGTLAMAKTQAPNSAGSQFFITHGDSVFLDGNYAAFGFVSEGIEVVDAYANVETGENDKPVEDVVIKSIAVELNGYELIEPIRNIIE